LNPRSRALDRLCGPGGNGARPWRTTGFFLSLIFWSAIPALAVENAIPSGFKLDRYRETWERNPFILAVAATTVKGPGFFDKLVLVSWLKDGAATIAYIQDTDTSEVQKVTNQPNENKLRLIEIHKDPDASKEEAVLSNGIDEGSVKFRLAVAAPPAASSAAPGAAAQPVGPAQNVQVNAPPIPPAPVNALLHPGMAHNVPLNQATLQAQQEANLKAAQQGAPSASATPGGLSPRRVRQQNLPAVSTLPLTTTGAPGTQSGP
jgi:hypothetical protein